MKRYLNLLLFILFLPFAVFSARIISQFEIASLPYIPFPTENAQWNVYLEYSISEAPVDTVLLRYFLCGDTTVNQLNYKKLCLEKGNLANPVRELSGLIREQDKRIYYKGIDFLGFPHEEEYLLYDFVVQEGDTVWHTNSGYDYTVIETIDSVEKYLPHLKFYTSGFEQSPFGIEWMRFDEDCPLHELVKTVPHLAFEVNDLDKELEEHRFNILTQPIAPSGGVRVVMIEHNGAPVELIEFSKQKG